MKITTFSEYQKETNFLKISLDKFLEKHPDTVPEVKELLALAYDGLGLGEAGEVQGKIKKINGKTTNNMVALLPADITRINREIEAINNKKNKKSVSV